MNKRAVIVLWILLFWCGAVLVLMAYQDNILKANMASTAQAGARQVAPTEKRAAAPPPENEPESPSDSVQPTQKPDPSNTPHTTETPVMADTPIPTNTAASTDAPEYTVEEIAFFVELVEISTQYLEAFTKVSELSQAINEDPGLILDQDWLSESAAVLSTIGELNDRVESLDPPERFVEIHQDFLTAASHFENFIQLLTEGIEDRDPEKINEASQALLEGGQAVRQVVAILAEIGSELSIDWQGLLP